MRAALLRSAQRSAFMLGTLNRQSVCSFVPPMSTITSVKRSRHTYGSPKPNPNVRKPLVLPNGAKLVETDTERAIELLESCADWIGSELKTKAEVATCAFRIQKVYTAFKTFDRQSMDEPQLVRILKNWDDLAPQFTVVLDSRSRNPWYEALVYMNLWAAAREPGLSTEARIMMQTAAYEWRLSTNTGRPHHMDREQTTFVTQCIRNAKFQLAMITFASPLAWPAGPAIPGADVTKHDENTKASTKTHDRHQNDPHRGAFAFVLLASTFSILLLTFLELLSLMQRGPSEKTGTRWTAGRRKSQRERGEIPQYKDRQASDSET